MSVAGLTGSVAAGLAQQLQKQAQAASTAAADLARQFEQQASTGAAAQGHAAHAPGHTAAHGTGGANDVVQAAAAASGIDQVA